MDRHPDHHRARALLALAVAAAMSAAPAHSATLAVGDTIVSRALHLRQAPDYVPWTYAESNSRELLLRQATAYVPWTYAETHSRELPLRQAAAYVSWTYAEAYSRSFHARHAPAYTPFAYTQAHSRVLHSYSNWTAGTPADGLPIVFAFHAPSPNPAHTGALVRFDLPSARRVSVDVLDVMGRRVRTLADRAAYAPGRWSLRLDQGRLPSGLYFVRFSAGEFKDTKRLVIVE